MLRKKEELLAKATSKLEEYDQNCSNISSIEVELK
jgi:hypothetical protein